VNDTLEEDELKPEDDSVDDAVAGTSRPVGGADGGDRASWMYLLVIGLLGLVVLGLGFAGRDSREPLAVGSTDAVVSAENGRSVTLEMVVDGGTVRLTGELPDDGAVGQMVALATARFGEGNVSSSLVVNPAVTLIGGVVNVSGTAEEGDIAPNGLQSDISAAFGIQAGSFDVTRTEPALTPVRADAVVGAGVIELSGAFPDQASVDQYVLAAETIYGTENVRAANVTIDRDTTLSGATFGIAGLVDAGDTRATDFQGTVLAFFGGSNADTSGLAIDTSPEALARLEERLRAEVASEPILFASGQATIDPTSEAILVRLAEAINAAPGIDVEVVGHTDGEGAVEINQEISERRAQAVVDRLIELGVDAERLRARGAGESEPIADNETEEGRAQNRRIAFEFDGAG
jgi:outer membrane protein OmpA-like peptidoglycan-associated protein